MTTDQPQPSHDIESGRAVDVVDGRVGFVPYLHAVRSGRIRAQLLTSPPVYALSLACLAPVQAAGSTVVVNGEFTVLSLSPALVAVAAVLLALAVLASLVGHGAVILLGIAAAIEVRDTSGATDADAPAGRAPSTRLPTAA